MTREQKIYCKIGQAVINGMLMLGFCASWISILVYALVK